MGIFGATSIANSPVILQTTHLFPLQMGQPTLALCGAGKVTVIAFFLFILRPLTYSLNIVNTINAHSVSSNVIVIGFFFTFWTLHYLTLLVSGTRCPFSFLTKIDIVPSS
jgi:hypothetical protein